MISFVHMITRPVPATTDEETYGSHAMYASDWFEASQPSMRLGAMVT